MKYRSAAAFRAALDDRINSAAARENITHSRLRKMIVFDRLLARLLIVAPDRWILKGGVALNLRLGNHARATQDLDLALNDTEEAATEDLLAAVEVDLGDFFYFTIERAAAPIGDENVTVRYHLRAKLAERRFEDIVLDIGLGDVGLYTPDFLPGIDFLAFVDLPRLTIPAISIGHHLAQKVHAYTRIYEGGRSSSRVKDLIDIVLIRSSTSSMASHLTHAVQMTFYARGTHRMPVALPSPPDDWVEPYRRLALAVGIDPDITVGHRLAADFLNPVLSNAINPEVFWDAALGRWSK